MIYPVICNIPNRNANPSLSRVQQQHITHRNLYEVSQQLRETTKSEALQNLNFQFYDEEEDLSSELSSDQYHENGTYESEDRKLEHIALLDLFNATNGDHWYNQRGWGTDKDYCFWYGIICNSSLVSVLYVILPLLSNYYEYKLFVVSLWGGD